MPSKRGVSRRPRTTQSRKAVNSFPHLQRLTPPKSTVQVVCNRTSGDDNAYAESMILSIFPLPSHIALHAPYSYTDAAACCRGSLTPIGPCRGAP